MNKSNEEFLKRNGINPEEVSKKVDCVIYSQDRLNPIISDYGFFRETGIGQVSVVDIIGDFSDSKCNSGKTIFETMDDRFDSEGDGYHSRSIGMLDYDKDNILNNLNYSFNFEPITVCETGEDGKYTIYTNGLHRFTVLKVFCLKELADADGDEQKIEEIKKKYTIPAKITEVDLEQTYCKYLLQEVISDTGDIKRIQTNFNENWKPTGKVELVDSSNEKRVVDTEELLQITRERFQEHKRKNNIPFIVQYNMEHYSSFRDFMEENFEDILENQKELEGSERIND